jgi:D-alanyl-D-alanine carboxypeptidase/D-alanyl-D-alanine-endopeptidase (penicillin-binding protein 4)
MRRLWFAASILFCGLAAQAQTQPAPALTPAPAAPVPAAHPAFPHADATPVGAQIAALLADPTVSRAHWGIAVTALDGTPLYGLDEDKLFRPASNAKLFTSAAAMALLKPDATVTTTVRGNFNPASGTVEGDLTLVGAGDANLGGSDLPYIAPSQRVKDAPKPLALLDLRDLADQLAAKGVKRITGKVVGNDQFFAYQPYGSSWDLGDIVWGYGAPVSALTVADNELKLTVTPGTLAQGPGKPGTAAAVTLDQNGVPYYTVESEILMTPAGTGSHVDVRRQPGQRVLDVYGSMAADAQADVEQVSIDDPALYAALALRGMLVARGIQVDGEAGVSHRPTFDGHSYLAELRPPPDGCELARLNGTAACQFNCSWGSFTGEVLASHISAPLAEDVTLTLKVSQNLHAELLLHRLGLLNSCPGGPTVGGARMVRAFLLNAGLDGDDFLFYDGSGLSGHDLVTPRATAQLLAYATKQPWFAQWKAALPVGGEDGSLTSRFPDPPLKDHVFAKTGTLGESRALSGYLDCASGKQVIFSVFVDNHTAGSSADRVTMDKMVAAIAANN